MSKANTLFNYFTKSPAVNGKSPGITKKSPDESKTSKKVVKQGGTPKSSKAPAKKAPVIEDDIDELTDESEDLASPIKKRKRILMPDSDDSDDEYKPAKKELEEESDSAHSGESEHEPTTEDELSSDDEVSTPKRKRKTETTRRSSTAKKPRNGFNQLNGKTVRDIVSSPPTPRSTPSTPISAGAKSKLALFANKETPNSKSSPNDELSEGKTWAHLTYSFLKPDKILDAKRKPPSHPEYDPKTIHVPEEFKRNLTPAMRQWWEIKSNHFDCVLFFKVGKFYELYHMDAVIGVNELNISFMKGDFAHSGFPEVAYSRFAPLLVEKGYRVARIEQTETPNMMEDRCRTLGKPTKFDRVVKRELCQVTTKGTRTSNISDGDACGDAGSRFLLAITERSGLNGSTAYGVSFIDTTIGVFHLGQFEDDRHCSRLRTLFAHHPPVQVLYERDALSPKTLQLLSSPSCGVPPSLRTALFPETEFWGAHKTLSYLMDGKYFSDGKETKSTGLEYWPKPLRKFISESDQLGMTPSNDGELALRSLGALVWYLQTCCLEQQLLAMKLFETFIPVDSSKPEEEPKEKFYKFGKYMVVDGVTVENLDLLSDSECSLISRLNHCCTPFGRRLLRHWVSAPLCDINAIQARQEAISWLLSGEGQSIAKTVKGKLAGIPDLERMLSAIHSNGNEVRSKTHPDSRAIFYEDKIYSKRRINDFLAALGGFKILAQVSETFEGVDCQSKLLLQATHTKQTSPNGRFPELKEALDFFDEAFNHNVAKQEGRIIPVKGVDQEYDSSLEEIAAIEEELNEHLKEQKKVFGCKVTYFGTDRKRYQIEVPDNACKHATDDHTLQSQRKGFKRYYTPEGKELLTRMMAAEDKKAASLRDLNRRIFAQFSNYQANWVAAVECISVLDVLLSLAEYSRSQEGEVCVPKFYHPSDLQKPFIDIKEGRHPCILITGGFIPNDTAIGQKPGDEETEKEDNENDASLILVTGPNMGGKSTLMRQVGLIVILAQMGCHVPASSCQLTPVDRVFTRLGASDRIENGESTFCVEMSETAAILRHATSHSLILMDELGRGTATYDGTAIAAAVVKELVEVGCRTLFSTHYHSLVNDFAKWSGVSLGHMACMVETEEVEDFEEEKDEGGQERVTFLYQFTPGACPKSHGFHAARLAGIPKSVVTSAWKAAKEMETKANARKAFKALFSAPAGAENLKERFLRALAVSG